MHNLQQSAAAAAAAQATVTFNGAQHGKKCFYGRMLQCIHSLTAAAPVYTTTVVTNPPNTVVPLMQSRAGNHLPVATIDADTVIRKQAALAEKPLDAPLQAIMTPEEA